MIALVLFLAAAASAEPVTCTYDERPLPRCRMVDAIAADGTHRLRFTSARRSVTIVARAQDGWWSGTLDGMPAMGYERNRGNTVFATTDLRHRFGWWYPADEHGTY